MVFYIFSLDTVSKTQEELFQEAGSSDYMRDMKKAEWKIQLTSIWLTFILEYGEL